MITAEPVDFFPRGRSMVAEHPGPLTFKQQLLIPGENLLYRMQNVNISSDTKHYQESWVIRELFKECKEQDYSGPKGKGVEASLFDSIGDNLVNTEEELYFMRNTAVWSKGEKRDRDILPATCFTCDTPIKYAFFCSRNFLHATKELNTICIIDTASIRFYCENGEDYITNLEFPISNVWNSQIGIILEKEASNAVIQNHSISMPRIFSLIHPLHEMAPILNKSANAHISYLTETEFRVIYISDESDLVLMYDNKIGKHFLSKLRKATEDEINFVGCCDPNTTDNQTRHMSLFSHNSMKMSGFQKNSTAYMARSSLGTSHVSRFLSATNPHSVSFNAGNQTQAQFQSPLNILQSTFGGHTTSIHDMRKMVKNQPAKPIKPEYCLEHLWTESVLGKDFCEISSKAFLHTDIMGKHYLCYLLPRTTKLQLVPIDRTIQDESTIFGRSSVITARDAVPLKQLKMIAVLSPCGSILMYSGPTSLSKVHVSGNIPVPISKRLSVNSPFPRRSSLLPTSKTTENSFDEVLHTLSPVHPLQPGNSRMNDGNCTNLRDPAGNRLTLVYPNGKMIRVTIPMITETLLVKKCLKALRKIIKKDVYLMFVSRFYSARNAPGAKDLTLEKEWNIFKNTISEFIGRNHSLLNESFCNEEPKNNKKRKTDSEEDMGCDEDWEFLLSIIKRKSFESVRDSNELKDVDTTAPLFQQIPLFFFSFHLLYEDLKLNWKDNTEALGLLAEFLYQLGFDMKLKNYCFHYILDFPKLAKLNGTPCFTEANGQMMQHKDLLQSRQIPNVFKTIYQIIAGRENSKYPCMEGINSISRNIIQAISLIYHGIYEMKTYIELLEYGEATKSKPRRMISRVAKRPEQLAQMLINMNITRNDITRLPLAIHLILAHSLETLRIDPPIGSSAETYDLIVRPDLIEHTRFQTSSSDDIGLKYYRSNVDMENSLSLRSPPMPHFTPKNESMTNEDDGMEYVDTKLLSLRFPDDLRIQEVRRILNSSEPVIIDITQAAGISDHEFLEEQEKQLYSYCLRTMTLPIGRGMFTLRTCIPTPTDTLPVPKLCLTGKEPVKGATIEMTQIEYPANMGVWPKFHNGVAAGLRVSPSATDIDSTWIVYNKPKGDNSTGHAGFLMALGLNGHLKTLSFMSVYEYLVKCDELTSVGLLLGISATYRGTMDNRTTKMLSVHIEALLPATTLELDISQNVQIASLMGIGLVYQGTAKRHIAEVLLNEIGRPPGPEMENSFERESYALTAGLSLGLVTLGQGESPAGLRDLQLPDTLHYYMIGGNRRPLTGAQKEKYKLPSFQVKEGDTVNVDVTAPGATLALGLMFFNTSNKDVAAWMKPPDTTYLLDLIRPDLLLLRIIARGLILWDEIRSDSAWLYGQFPATLKFDLKKGPQNTNIEIDHEANAQAYCNIIAGAAFCVGLKFAGTRNEEAYKTLRTTIKLFLSVNGQYVGEYTGRTTIENCLILCLISISLVYAGTGDLEILRIIRYLRSRIGPNHSHITYGSHMGITMALGFLFLSCGRYSISRTPESIAALVISLFPKFPNHSNDNRYHLQAFRHLYILAVEPRIFLPRDIDTRKLCLADITCVQLSSNEVIKCPMAPCILPELSTLKSVLINDKNYWPVSFERDRNWDQLKKILENCGCVDIKRRSGCLSYIDDPYRLKSLLAQTLTTEEYNCWHIDYKSLLAFSSDPKVIRFAEKFACETILKDDPRLPVLMLTFYNCLIKDKMHVANIYYSLMEIKEKPALNSVDVWQVKLIESFLNQSESQTLISPEIIGAIQEKNIQKITAPRKRFNGELKHFISTECFNFMKDIPEEDAQCFVNIVNYYGLLPNCANLVHLNGNVNFIRLLYEFKKLGFSTETIKCINDIININEK